jgi:hypothetical protein
VPFCRIERAISSKRVFFRTDEVMVLDDPGQPVGDIGNRRMHLSVTDGLARCWRR